MYFFYVVKNNFLKTVYACDHNWCQVSNFCFENDHSINAEEFGIEKNVSTLGRNYICLEKIKEKITYRLFVFVSATKKKRFFHIF